MTTNVLAVVILNWNAWQDTLTCIESVTSADVPLGWTIRVMVIDNGSDDGSPEFLRAHAGAQFELIEHQRNDGYAGGNNVGLVHALVGGADAICVMNNDTTVDPAMFAELLKHLDGRRLVALSPLIAFADAPDILWFAGSHYDRRESRPVHVQVAASGRPYATEALSGCCIVATARVWQQVGLFDARYFLIFEDSDWSYRARAQNVDLVIVPSARMQHKVSRSFVGPAEGVGLYYFVRNGLMFNHDHLTRRGMLSFLWRLVARPSLGDLRRGQTARPLVRLLACADHVRSRYGAASSLVMSTVAKTRLPPE